MAKNHPEYKAATADLSKVFSDLKCGNYEECNDFVDALDEWSKKYSQRLDISSLTVNEQIQILGGTETGPLIEQVLQMKQCLLHRHLITLQLLHQK